MENIFELYDMPMQLAPDKAKVKVQYYALCRLYHPDRVAQEAEDAQAAHMSKSAWVNEGYKILTDPDKTLQYILKWHGVLADEEKYALPNSFLMEMMDLNDTIDMAQEGEGSISQAEAALEEAMETWELAYKPLQTQYEQGFTEDLLMKLKDMYFRKKYFLRIKERITTFASH